MKYGELVAFDPIETVVQLSEADHAAEAERLVRSFVISDRLGQHLANLVFPQLQFVRPTDNKGLFIVGNYGTGKSHLMAVISAVAEHEGLAGQLNNAHVANAASDIAGRFVVIRAEINSTMRLREFVMLTLQDQLAAHG